MGLGGKVVPYSRCQPPWKGSFIKKMSEVKWRSNNKTKKKQPIPEPTPIKLKSSRYQSKKAEKEVEIDMPRMTDDELRDTFFRPFKIEEED